MVSLLSLIFIHLMQFSCLECRELAEGAHAASHPAPSAAEHKAKQEQKATVPRWSRVTCSRAKPCPSPMVSTLRFYSKWDATRPCREVLNQCAWWASNSSITWPQQWLSFTQGAYCLNNPSSHHLFHLLTLNYFWLWSQELSRDLNLLFQRSYPVAGHYPSCSH